MPFTDPIEVPVPIAPTIYDGTMQAHTFELAEPGLPVTSKLIRTTQDWGVEVDWEMHGPLAVFLDGDFHLTAYIESIGPGPEMKLPGADVVVNSLSAALAFLGVPPVATRTYHAVINIPPGTVPAGAYKIVTLLQMYGPSGKYPIAGLCEGPVLDIFVP